MHRLPLCRITCKHHLFSEKNMCALQPSSYSESSGGAADGLDIIVFKIMINK